MIYPFFGKITWWGLLLLTQQPGGQPASPAAPEAWEPWDRGHAFPRHGRGERRHLGAGRQRPPVVPARTGRDNRPCRSQWPAPEEPSPAARRARNGISSHWGCEQTYRPGVFTEGCSLALSWSSLPFLFGCTCLHWEDSLPNTMHISEIVTSVFAAVSFSCKCYQLLPSSRWNICIKTKIKIRAKPQVPLTSRQIFFLFPLFFFCHQC